MPKIEFLIDPSLRGVVPEPVLAERMLPDWFLRIPKGVGTGADGPFGGGTVKLCSPFFDALGGGYFLLLPQALHIDPTYSPTRIEWKVPGFGGVTNFLDKQMRGSGFPTAHRFETPWHLKLPPGYSALLTHPMNRVEAGFRVFSGVIDDPYQAQLNPPFYVTATKPFYLDAGEIIAQIIPFRREDWKFAVEERSSQELAKPILRMKSSLGGYRRLAWRRKRWQ